MESRRDLKGRSLFSFPEDYTVIDIETTGISPDSCEIIEISALRCRGRRACESFSTLVRPRRRISRFITELTGITNGMVAGAPDISSALKGFAEFVGEDILMGYNVNFDINFLYDHMMACHGRPVSNDFVDVLRFSRRALKGLSDHKQTTVAAHYGINVEGAHRALKDCEICNQCYLNLLQESALAGEVRV